MEKKTTQRMVGILVVAALIVIMLPLIFNGSTTQATSQTAEVKAPPFPDQASMDQANNQSASDVNASGSINISQDTANSINKTTDNTTTPAVVATAAETTPAAPDSSIEIKGQPAAPTLTAAAMPSEPATAAPAVTAVVPPAVAPASPQPTASEIAAITTPNVTATPDAATPAPQAATVAPAVEPKVQKTAAVEPKHVKKTIVASKLSHEDLVKLKSAAWAVQMGSFKVKNNAERLANQLRAQGYKAFTREIRSSTRVYVGPEFKQASASSLAQKLEQNLNMHGIVVPFQPLEL